MNPYYQDKDVTVYNGDVLAVLQELPSESVDCCITSPPYWGLRDYGTGTWEGGDPACDHKVRKNAQIESSTLSSGRSTTGHQKEGFKTYCPRCGARRIDSQIGLEATPEEYVAKMVEVFREVRRVLKKEGTCWLNLGDSYNGSGGDHKEGGKNDASFQTGLMHGVQYKNITALKPKDIVGIPWRTALALQAPYYTGRIKNEADRIWLAAMIDGEGCMFIHKRKAGASSYAKYRKTDGIEVEYTRKQDTYGAGLEVANTHESIVKRCMEITGKGSICFQDKESKLKNRNQRLFRWNMRSNECRDIIREVYPYLTGKKHEARLLLGCPSSGEDAEKAHQGLMNLHNGLTCSVDFPEPESMYEQGWYLRQEIIWAKKNCMPESVTDRCTKSHEQVFLLAKSEHYFYDAEAIKEPASWNTNERQARAKIGQKSNPDAKKNGIRPKVPSGWDTEVGSKHNTAEWSAKRKRGDPRDGIKNNASFDEAMLSMPDTRNKRSVWEITTKPYKEAHFATFPPDLVEPMIKAGTSAKGVCEKCGKAWERIVESSKTFQSGSGKSGNPINGKQDLSALKTNTTPDIRLGPVISSTTIGWRPTCKCGEHGVDTIPATVLDPFSGSGTTLQVAKLLNRRSIGIEIKPEYCDLIVDRCRQQMMDLGGECI